MPAIDWDAVLQTTLSDADLARRTGLSRVRIGKERRRRGIPARAQGGRPAIYDFSGQPLGQVTHRVIALATGATIAAVSAAARRRGIYRTSNPCRGIRWDDQPLGQEPDAVIARRLGVRRNGVRDARRRRGIRGFGIDWSVHPLGQIPDSELARRLGFSRSTVKSARLSRGIPPFRSSSSALCG